MADEIFQEFEKKTRDSLEYLFNSAKKKNEFAYVFSLLGINFCECGVQWQPITETYYLVKDLTSLAGAPLPQHTKARLLLFCYMQITEASYIYNAVYNMLVSIEEDDPSRFFNFFDLYKEGVPPPANSKVNAICEKADRVGQQGIKGLLNAIFNYGIKNAIAHADYILYENELRFRHGGVEMEIIKLEDILALVRKTIIFFETFFAVLDAHRMSYQDGKVIGNRKNKNGSPLADIILIVDSQAGLVGFQQNDSLPIW